MYPNVLIYTQSRFIVQWISMNNEDTALDFMSNECEAISKEYTKWPWISTKDLVSVDW